MKVFKTVALFLIITCVGIVTLSAKSTAADSTSFSQPSPHLDSQTSLPDGLEIHTSFHKMWYICNIIPDPFCIVASTCISSK